MSVHVYSVCVVLGVGSALPPPRRRSHNDCAIGSRNSKIGHGQTKGYRAINERINERTEFIHKKLDMKMFVIDDILAITAAALNQVSTKQRTELVAFTHP
jgi:hypothetical protein